MILMQIYFIFSGVKFRSPIFNNDVVTDDFFQTIKKSFECRDISVFLEIQPFRVSAGLLTFLADIFVTIFRRHAHFKSVHIHSFMKFAELFLA